MSAAYNAQGYALLVNRNGDIDLLYMNGSGTTTTLWHYAGTTATRNAVTAFAVPGTTAPGYGIQLEVRTNNADPNQLEIWADKTLLTSSFANGGFVIPVGSRFSNWQNAQHLGLLAYTTNSQQRISGQTNFVRFADREVCNAGTQTTVTAAPQSDGSMITTILVGPGGGVTEKRILYTATQVAFLQNGGSFNYNTALTQTPLGTAYQGPTTSTHFGGHIVNGSAPRNDMIYVGNDPTVSGAIGLGCIPSSVSISGGVSVPSEPHLLVSPYTDPQNGQNPPISYLHINGLPLVTSGAPGPWAMDSITLTARWYPFRP